MRSLEITFRRKYKAPDGTKVNYGNSTETVEKPGKKDPEIIPCFRVEINAPTNANELNQDIGGEKMWDKFVDTVYTGAFKDLVKSEVLLKLGEKDEETEEGRAAVIAKVERLAGEFTMNRVISEVLSGKAALDEINSPEMQELAKNDPLEFTRRVQNILATTRGVKAA
jgi:hypothetical protein